MSGLTQLLEATIGGAVAPEDVGWEPRRGFVTEALVGRPLLFLGRAEGGERRDLYRAWVRLGLEGKPVGVTRVFNLTRTPLGDEVGLRVRGTSAVLATTAYGKIQGITVLRTDGIAREDLPPRFIDRLLLAVSSYQATGSTSGVGRLDVFLGAPATTASLRLTPPELVIETGSGDSQVIVDLDARRVRARDGEPPRARLVPQTHGEKSPVLWAVDAVRGVVGSDAIAWLEKFVFNARDAVKRVGFGIFSTARPAPRREAPRALAVAAPAGSEESWPPPRIPSAWEEPEPGEGEWRPVEHAFLAKLPSTKGTPPPYFYRTFTRPDLERPYSEVWFVAMDMRQLELDVEAGYEDPAPLVGPPGSGRLPDDPKVLDRVVAAFNGAFKTTHGEYGMMVNRRVLVPPVPGAATVAVTTDGEAGFGTWPEDKALPADVVSFRQNLDPLVADGVANPTGRSVWGWHLAGQSVLTERTALCLTRARHVYYAWGREISGPGLAKALVQAGCEYAVHLDMNPKHCGFAFMDIVDLGRQKIEFSLAHEGMSVNPLRYALWSPKDFFYVKVRDPSPPAVPGVEFRESASTQPPPAWMPGLFEATVQLGQLPVQVLLFDEGRFDWVVRASEAEPAAVGRRPKLVSLGPEQASRVLGAVNLGHTTEVLRYGIAFAGEASLDLRRSYATLVLSPGEAPRVVAPGEPLELGREDEAVQLPLLADAGQLIPQARDRGSHRARGAFCVTPLGRVFVAFARHDSSDPAALALLRAGCSRVLGLDRGSRHDAFVHLAGTGTPPLDRYETTMLYALSRPMVPRAFRFPRNPRKAKTGP